MSKSHRSNNSRCPGPIDRRAFLKIGGLALGGLSLPQILAAQDQAGTPAGKLGHKAIIMIFLSDRLRKVGKLKPLTEQGILFWSAIYIPIVVAMAAKQNVVAAVSSGWLAVAAGVGAVVVSFALVPVLTRMGRRDD